MVGLVSKRFANFITFLNIVFGSTAILYTINGNYILSAILILAAVMMDGLDGKVARKLKTSSDLGKELDSLCDIVSFGVAPAVLLYTQVLASNYHFIGLAAFLLYIICGAYRLARFNVMNISQYFLGLPITIAGGLLALISLLAAYLHPLVILLLVIALSLFMVSSIRLPKL